MKNRLIKFTLIGAKLLIRLKQGLIFLFSGFLGKIFESFGYFLTHWIFFPLYKFFNRIRRAYLKRFGSFQKTVLELISNRIVLIVVLSVFAIFALGTESRALSSNDSLSGKYNLFFVYVGPGEEDFGVVEEGGAEVGIFASGQNNAEVGVSVPTGLPGAQFGEDISTETINYGDTGVVVGTFMPGAVPAGPRDTIVDYTIQPGDTLGGIATRFNISLQTLIWENNLTAKSLLQVGQKLRVLPVSGVSHKVKKGETIARIAKLYTAKTDEIYSFNKIDDTHLAVGSIIIIPGGKKITTESLPSSQLAAPGRARGRYLGGTPPPSLRNVGQGMIWPTTVRYITQYFKLRHPGLDIAGPMGIPIYAADDGTVVASGWNRGGYGYMILIDHGNGLMTRYGHNSQLFVEIDEHVSKGQTISLMGSSERSTGSHLHFEVVAGGVRVNPFLYIR